MSPGRLVVRGSKQLLSGLLNLSPAESSSRVRQAHELGVRISMTGEPLPPLLPLTAAARGEGSITAQHVDVIVRAMTTRRAASLPVDEQAQAEAFLVEQAHCSTRSCSPGSRSSWWRPSTPTAASPMSRASDGGGS